MNGETVKIIMLRV